MLHQLEPQYHLKVPNPICTIPIPILRFAILISGSLVAISRSAIRRFGIQLFIYMMWTTVYKRKIYVKGWRIASYSEIKIGVVTV